MCNGYLLKTHTLTLCGKYVFCEYMQMRGLKMENETHDTHKKIFLPGQKYQDSAKIDCVKL